MSQNYNNNGSSGGEAGDKPLPSPLLLRPKQDKREFSILKKDDNTSSSSKLIVDTSSDLSVQDIWNKMVNWAFDNAKATIAQELELEHKHPFSSEVVTGKLHIAVPTSGINTGDILAQCIVVLSTLVHDDVELDFYYSSWEEPNWDREARLYLTGVLASAHEEAPSSFAATSSPIDLTRVAVWAEACHMALAQKKSHEQVRATVLPTNIVGGQSATRYLSKVYAHLRSAAGKGADPAVRTLERLLKLFCRRLHDTAIMIIRKQKIPWSDVLFKGASTEAYKVKQQVRTRVVTPAKPSRSPWWHREEAAAISNLVNSYWQAPEKIRTEWVALKSEQQHSDYSKYVSRVREAYQEMKRVSELLFAQSGHRKRYILAALKKEQSNVSKKKRQQRSNFQLADAFWKLDLTGCYEPVKWAFSPIQSIGRLYPDASDMVVTLNGKSIEQAEGVTKAWSESENIRWSDYAKITRFWIRVFKPNLDQVKNIPREKDFGPVLKDDNIFKPLSADTADDDQE
jgi:hypothetical protein